MSLSVRCPRCDHQYRLAEGLAGKRARCAHCGEVMRIPSAPAPDLGAQGRDEGRRPAAKVPRPAPATAPGLDVYGLLDERPRPAPASEPELGPRPKAESAPRAKKRKVRSEGFRGHLERLEGWPGGKAVWWPALGVSALGLVILGLTHLERMFLLLTCAGFFCFVWAGAVAVTATFGQGFWMTLRLCSALTMTLTFLLSLTGATKLGPVEAGGSAIFCYAVFFLRAPRLELYWRPMRLAGYGVLLLMPGAAVVGVGMIVDHRPRHGLPATVPAVARARANAGRRHIAAEPTRSLPRLPDVGPGRELEPGVTFHEMRLPGGPSPGFSGKLWLYLPSGEHAPKSLPCVMITGAGSNVISGMELGDSGDGDRPEHLPYVRAGFAVLAYELDGMLRNRDNPSNAEIMSAGRTFLAARAGLVNAHIALEFLLAKVPQVDPARIFTAGHSSAGTMALLFAEHEPRLRGCVAYAPAVDLEERFGFIGCAQLRGLGLGELITRYSPKNNEAKLACPVFLFHALDDSNVAASMSQACADRLRAMGKSVTLETVPTGEHYMSMIQQGIPRAIEWLKGLSAAAAAQAATPPPATPAAFPSNSAPAPSAPAPVPPGGQP